MSNSLTDLETKEFLLSIIGNSPIGTIVLDMEGNITVINNSAKELLGLKEKINTYLNKFILSQVVGIKELDGAVIDCITNGRKPFNIIEVEYHQKYLNIKGQKTLNGMVLAFEDLTSVITSRNILKQKSEELEKKNLELTEFNHITSHDLQEPLKTVIGFSNLLKEESITIDEEGREYVEIISQVAVNMSSKINELLEYSRLGRTNILSSVDCNHIFNKLKTNIKSTIKDKKVTIEYDKLPVIYGYKEDIYSLFQNLVSNSIKFHTQKNPIKIIITSTETKDFWLFSVEDNGIGIAPQNTKKIFTIFQRLHNIKEFPGTGIGLAMSKKIVEIHHGEIWVESETDKGSNFSFTIKKIYRMNNLKLLLIDDDPISNFLTKKVVEKANINADIIIYDNAANALSLFENFIDINEIPDAIFLDLNMPIMNGWEFIEHFSKLDDEVIAKVSLFILSASDNHYDISTAARYSFIKKYISKPIAIKEVESLFSSHKCLEV